MIYVSIILYLLLSVLVCLRWFKEISFSKFVISLFIIINIINILVVEALHFFRWLNDPILYLAFQGFLCAICAVLVLDPLRKIYKEPLPKLWFKFLKPSLVEGVLLFFILVVLGLAFYVGTISPINNSDSLHSHLPRIYYWLQHGSLQSWYPTADTQISYPINITLQGLWLFLLGGTENFFFLATWLALVLCAVLLYEIALLIGAQRGGALVASLVGLTFPVVLLQTYSYQGDVYVAALILCAVFFLLRFVKHNQNPDLYYSVLMVIVALGGKQTAFLFLPIFILALILVFRKRVSLRVIFNSAALAMIIFVLFSSFKVIQNRTETKLSESHMISPGFLDNLLNASEKPFEGYLTNGLRYLYQAISLDGLNGQLRLNLEEAKKESFKNVTARIHIDLEARKYLPPYEEGFFDYDTSWPVNEDGSWFGPLSFTLLPLAMIVTLFKKGKMHKVYLLFAFLLLLIFIFGQVVLKADGWGANRGRHMTIAALALTPLVAFLVPRQRFFNTLLAILIAILSVYLSVSVLLINDSRPTITTNSLHAYMAHKIEPIKITNYLNSQYVYRIRKTVNSLLLTSPDRENILDSSYYGKLFYQANKYQNQIEFINSHVGQEEDLYIRMESSLLEYALFGVNRTREVSPVKTLDEVPPGNTVLVLNSLDDEIPTRFSLIAQNELYSIYHSP